MRKIEAFIFTLIVIIGICFCINILLAHPTLHDILEGFIPSLPDAKELYAAKGIHNKIPSETALYIAIGIIGATVMPHNLYLHSALVQTRKIKKTPEGIRQALKWSFVDSAIALNIAFLINAAILILAATVFFKTGRTDVGDISRAHELLSPLLGSSVASTLFAIALIASGQSSTITGTLSGQIVMEGYLRLRINPMMRRLTTRLVAIVPAIIFISLTGESNVGSLLIFSQVILSLQLGFAIIPLIHFVSDKKTMGAFTIKPIIQILAWLMAAVLIFLNIKMISEESFSFFYTSDQIWIKILIILIALIFLSLLLYSIIYPLVNKRNTVASILLHTEMTPNNPIYVPVYNKIAIALDFSENDYKLISAALGQGGTDKEIILIHIVESVSAKLHGDETADYESEKDKEQLDYFVSLLKEKNIKAKGILGYKERSKEIIRIVKDEQADILVIGAHGHAGIKDFIYGSTINAVRHELKIPVFIVNI